MHDNCRREFSAIGVPYHSPWDFQVKRLAKIFGFCKLRTGLSARSAQPLWIALVESGKMEIRFGIFLRLKGNVACEGEFCYAGAEAKFAGTHRQCRVICHSESAAADEESLFVRPDGGNLASKFQSRLPFQKHARVAARGLRRNASRKSACRRASPPSSFPRALKCPARPPVIL